MRRGASIPGSLRVRWGEEKDGPCELRSKLGLTTRGDRIEPRPHGEPRAMSNGRRSERASPLQRRPYAADYSVAFIHSDMGGGGKDDIFVRVRAYPS